MPKRMHVGERLRLKEVRTNAIREMARTKYASEGSIEIDSNAKLSEGDDNGTYVQAWVWVSFTGTEFDRGDD